MIDVHEMKKIAIITTYKCTASCRHCMMNSSPRRKEKLSSVTICETVKKFLTEGSPLELVIFTGGEATLLKDDLLDSIAFCSENDLKTRLITNAWWASTEKRAVETVESFCEAGLSEINFSADDYHQQYVKLDNIKNAWEASKNKGFNSVVIANMIGPHSHITGAFISEYFKEDIQEFWINKGKIPPISSARDGTKYLIANSYIQKLGRACSMPDAEIFYPLNPLSLKTRCMMVCKHPVLSADGNLFACCGFNAKGNKYLDLGNVQEKTITEVWDKAKRSLFVRAMHKLGPYFIMNFVKDFLKKDIFKDRYSSICEICYDISNNKESIEVMNDHSEKLESLISTKVKNV